VGSKSGNQLACHSKKSLGERFDPVGPHVNDGEQTPDANGEDDTQPHSSCMVRTMVRSNNMPRINRWGRRRYMLPPPRWEVEFQPEPGYFKHMQGFPATPYLGAIVILPGVGLPGDRDEEESPENQALDCCRCRMRKAAIVGVCVHQVTA